MFTNICLFRFPFIKKPRLSFFVAGSIFFLFASVAALLLQLVILPHIFPDLHAGHGLLLGGDWTGYHAIGARLSDQIHIQGWGAWQLRPLDHAAAGVAAAFYALFMQEPYVLIPLNAFIHAVGGCLFMVMVRWVTNDFTSAFIAALPFVFFPSALAWYAQIGKDGFYFTGAYLCLAGWVILSRISTWQSGGVNLPVLGLLSFLLGIALMGSMRIYAFQLMQGVGYIFTLGLTLLFISRGMKRRLPWKKCILAILILTAIPLLLGFAPKETRGKTVFLNDVCVRQKNQCPEEFASTANPNHESERFGGAFADKVWQQTGFLPNFIEVSFLRISVLRQGYIETLGYKSAGSMIDKDISLSSFWDFIYYFPRALQIGFLAPFPNDWLSKAYSPGGGLMRLISAVEMCAVYFSLLFLPYAFWGWRNRVEFWMPITFSLIMILTYSYATPNVGSLYRLRYGFLMITVAFGLASASVAFTKFSDSLKKKLIINMNSTIQTRKCRFCSASLSHSFCDLGMSPVSNAFLNKEGLNRVENFYPLHAYVCQNCFLVQLEQFESPQNIFKDYAYFSSYSQSWLQHCETYAGKMINRFGLNHVHQVIEIASNDGYLLKYFKDKDIPVLGIEPAANVAKVAQNAGLNTLVKFFGQNTATELVTGGTKADLLLGNNVLAHVPDLNDFVSGMKILLKPEGVITMEFPHLMRLIEDNQFDTIYHEHFSYLSFKTVEKIFEHHGLKMFDVDELTTHGGSIRIYAQHHESRRHDISSRVSAMRAREDSFGLGQIDAYKNFGERVFQTKHNLLDFLIRVKRNKQTIVGYGAAAKGNTLLNFSGIRSDFLDYVVDKSPHKQGLFLPGTHLPILPPEKIRETKPDFVLILPWNIKDEIMEQMAFIRDWGGKFVVPIPKLMVI
jgi:hypothetical protein